MKRDIRTSIIYLCGRNKTFPSISELSVYTGRSIQEIKDQLQKLCDKNFIEKLPSGNYQLSPMSIANFETLGVIDNGDGTGTEIFTTASDRDSANEFIENQLLDDKKKMFYEKQDEETGVTYWDDKPDYEDNKKYSGILKANISKLKSFKNLYTTDKDYIIPITRIAMLIIGLGAVVVSVFYTSVWLLEFLPTFLALLLASIMVGFSVLAFEMIIMFLSGIVVKHWSKWFIVTGFSALWLIVAAFSITSTVAGQYNQHIKNSKEYAQLNESNKVDAIKWNSLKERKAELLERRVEKKSQLSTLIGIANQATTIETTEKHSSTITAANNRIYITEQALNKIESDLDAIRQEEKRMLDKNPSQVNSDSTEIPDFYSWIASVFKIKKDLAQFWMSLFPAIFVDIISPVALAVAMFLKRQK